MLSIIFFKETPGNYVSMIQNLNKNNGVKQNLHNNNGVIQDCTRNLKYKLQWTNVSGFVQEKATKDVVKEVTSFDCFAASENCLCVVLACSCTVRTVSNLERGH